MHICLNKIIILCIKIQTYNNYIAKFRKITQWFSSLHSILDPQHSIANLATPKVFLISQIDSFIYFSAL